MRRREFITLVGGGAVTLPLGACALPPTTPVIGVLSVTTPAHFPAFLQGLKVEGFVEGRNVAIAHRQAEERVSGLGELVADLVRRQVAVIVAFGGSGPALAAKAATSTIPIVFTTGDDPVRLGLVASLNRPGSNATGVSVSSTELIAKRIELLRELVPEMTAIAILGASRMNKAAQEHIDNVARAVGLKAIVLIANDEGAFEVAFASAAEAEVDGLLVSAVPFFMRHRQQIVALAQRYRMPTIYPWREYSDDGGLMSYAPDLADAYHQIGRYAARILKGAAPSDLPVLLPSKFELVVNLKTAKVLGLPVSRLLNARADRVIE
jgi:ABC-type uncharacterized transport system substrate-binding protein